MLVAGRGRRERWRVVRKVYGEGKLITCAICGLPLGPEEAKRCSVCGKIVCRDHIRYHPTHGWVCTNCLRRMTRKEEVLVIGISYIEL